jgi:hypothetical protein
MNFNLGNALKYIWRAGLKSSAREDLQKAVWYLQDEIRRLEEVSGVTLDSEEENQAPEPEPEPEPEEKKPAVKSSSRQPAVRGPALTQTQRILLSRLEDLGPTAKAKASALVSGLDINAIAAGRILGYLETTGHVIRVQDKPVSLWRARMAAAAPLNPGSKDIPVTVCPPRYATGYGINTGEIAGIRV